jgi:hypothetical protein
MLLAWNEALASSIDLPALRAFLRSHVESYDDLEAILALHRASEPKSAAGLASELSIDANEAQQILDRFIGGHLVGAVQLGREVHFRYMPKTQELASMVELLVRAYAEERAKLMELMTANAIERVRSNALRMFADGFRWGGPKKNG